MSRKSPVLRIEPGAILCGSFATGTPHIQVTDYRLPDHDHLGRPIDAARVFTTVAMGWLHRQPRTRAVFWWEDDERTTSLLRIGSRQPALGSGLITARLGGQRCGDTGIHDRLEDALAYWDGEMLWLLDPLRAVLHEPQAFNCPRFGWASVAWVHGGRPGSRAADR